MFLKFIVFPKRKTPPKKPPRSHSLELLDLDDCLPPPPPPPEAMMLASSSSPYIGDLETLEELRRAANAEQQMTQQRSVRAKSVTIHPDVTEFHYPGKGKISPFLLRHFYWFSFPRNCRRIIGWRLFNVRQPPAAAAAAPTLCSARSRIRRKTSTTASAAFVFQTLVWGGLLAPQALHGRRGESIAFLLQDGPDDKGRDHRVLLPAATATTPATSTSGAGAGRRAIVVDRFLKQAATFHILYLEK